jgi:predicted nucleotidyltransferase
VHIYAFGSICRGDLREGSDIDVLALVEGYDSRFDPDTFSVYSYGRVGDLWAEGNPFAWHLFLESRLVFASDRRDFLKGLGSPEEYVNCVRDCEKFYSVFEEARDSILSRAKSRVFELSTIFLSIRNIATCFSLGTGAKPDFSRHSAHHLGTNSIRLPSNAYSVLERARILSTRGKGENITDEEVDLVLDVLQNVKAWMEHLVIEARAYERIQKSHGHPTANSAVGKL